MFSLEIKFDVFFKKNLGILFKSNSVDLDGEEARVNIDLGKVEYMKANYLVENKKLTDTVEIIDIDKKLIQVPFKSAVRKTGKIEFELVAYMLNGDILPSQTYVYEVAEGIGEGKQVGIGGEDGHTHANLTTLNKITETKFNEWNNKANKEHTHENYSETTHNHNDLYANKEHEHDYSPNTHNHNDAYSSLNHNHNNLYAVKSSEHTHTNKSIIDKITDIKINEWDSKVNGDHNHDSKYATKASEHTHTNKTTLDKVTEEKISSWGSKAEGNHNHDDVYAKLEDTYNKLETDTKISEEIAKAQIGGDSNIDLSGYATKEDLKNKSDLGHTHSNYAENNHNHNSLYANIEHEHDYSPNTHNHDDAYSSINHNHNDLYATKASEHNHANKLALDKVTDIKIKEWDSKANGEHTHSNYANTTHNHDGKYATKSSEHNHTNKLTLDKVTDGKINEWNNKANSEHTHENLYYAKSDTYNKLETDTKISEEIAKAQIGGDGNIDLSAYATKEELKSKADKGHTHSNYSENTHNHNDLYANIEHEHEQYANSTHNHNELYAVKSSEHNHDNEVALDKVTDIKINEWNSKSNSNHYHDEYAPSTHNHDFSYYKKSETYTKSEANNKISEEIAKAQIGGGNGDIDLSAYATKADLETKANKNHLHPGYALDDHEHSDLYYRKNEVYTKGETETKILEEIMNVGVGGTPDLSGYATKEDLKSKSDINHDHNSSYANVSHIHTNYSETTHKHNEYANSNHDHNDLYYTKSETYKMWVGTQSQYDQIGLKNNSTLYFIKEG